MSSFLLFLLLLIITCLSTMPACNARYLVLHQEPLIPHGLEYGAQELSHAENGAKTKTTSAIEILASSQTKAKAMIQGVTRKRQGRSILGSSSYHAKEAEESQENDIGEDIEVTDYASPHRTPPIHNKKP